MICRLLYTAGKPSAHNIYLNSRDYDKDTGLEVILKFSKIMKVKKDLE